MNLNVNDWKEFKTSKLFYDMQNGKANQQMLEDGNECFYVGAKKDDNGVMLHCVKDESLMTKGNCIIFICNGQGSVGYANYMDVDFIGTTDIVAGYNDNLNEYTGLFLATIYSQERPKYSFGRKWKTHLADTKIKLPIQHNTDGTPFIDVDKKYSDDGYVPDWQFMEDYIKSLHHKPLTTNQFISNAVTLIYDDWKEFTLDDVFVLKGGFYNKKPEHSAEGDIPFLASTESNNGVTEYYNIEDIRGWDKVGNEDNTLAKKLYVGNCIAVTVNGSVCNAFYQKEQFTCSHDITAFYIKNHTMNPHLAMFLCTIIMKDKYRWSYGRKPHDVKKFGNSVIKLPVKHNADGTIFIDDEHTYSEDGYVPDWQFMEDYIKSLPYGDRL